MAYYGVIFGGHGIHNQLLMPKKVQKNAHGEPVKSKYNDGYIETYMDPADVSTTLVTSWSTKQEWIKKTDPAVNKVMMEIKTWLKAVPAAVVYHTGRDPCSIAHGNHYHFIVEPENIILHQTYRFRRLKALCRANDSTLYIKAERVKNLERLIDYCTMPPRQFFGTNNKLFGKLFAQSNKKPLQDRVSIPLAWDQNEQVDFSEILPADPEEATGGSGWEFDGDIVDNTFGEIDPPCPGAPTKRKAPLNDFEDDEEDNPPNKQVARRLDFDEFVPLPNKPKEAAYKPTLTQTMGELMIKAMEELGTTNKDEMIKRLHEIKRKDPNNYNVVNLLHKIESLKWMRINKTVWDGATEQVERNLSSKPLRFFIERTLQRNWMSNNTEDGGYLNLRDSLEMIDEFWQNNGIKLSEAIEKIHQCLAKISGKNNTIVLQGPSNCGKTVCFSKPLSELIGSVGHVPTLNLTSRFAFAECENKRLITIDECSVPKNYVESIKLLFGGEPMSTEVKCNKSIIIQRTPVIATTNRTPWLLCPEDEQPLRNRMWYVQVNTWEELAAYDNWYCNPSAYATLLSMYQRGVNVDNWEDHYLECDEQPQTTKTGFLSMSQESARPSHDTADSDTEYQQIN